MLKKIVLFIFIINYLFAITGKEVIEKEKKLQATNTEQSHELMILIDEDGTLEKRELKRYIKKNKKTNLRDALITFIKPTDINGVALLEKQYKKGEQSQWLYIPALNKLQRIAKGSKKNYFMGTDFTYEDLSPIKISNYTYKIIKEEPIKVAKNDKSEDCYVIEMTPTNQYSPETNYGKKIIWVTKKHFYTKKIEFYNKNNKLIKTQVAWDFINPVGTVYRPIKIKVDNIEENHKTLVKVERIKINKPIKNKVFSKSYLLNEEHMVSE